MCGTHYRNIKWTQNETLSIATGCQKMSTVNHLNVEAHAKGNGTLRATIWTVFARCLEPENVCQSITTRETPKRRMKATLYCRTNYVSE